MTKDTRSGLVYEVLRLVRDTKDKPKVLIMENVPDLIQVNFARQFGEIQLELENLGYMNYVETLNAKDFGIAQNRERVFMVSVLGSYSYSYPPYQKLEKRLKDYLEDEVDEKYYLSDKKKIKHINDTGIDTENFIQFERYNGQFEQLCRVWKDLSPTITTKAGDIIILRNDKYSLLSELECWRLMGISDEDFHKAKNSGVSNSQLYKQAGNAIVVDVFEAILNKMIEREKQ